MCFLRQASVVCAFAAALGRLGRAPFAPTRLDARTLWVTAASRRAGGDSIIRSVDHLIIRSLDAIIESK